MVAHGVAALMSVSRTDGDGTMFPPKTPSAEGPRFNAAADRRSRLTDRDLQAIYRRDGVVCLRNVLPTETLAAAERAWQWSLAHPGPGASRLLPDRTVSVASVADARRIEADDGGFFYQDLGHPRASEAYAELIGCGPIREILTSLFADADGRASAWFQGEQIFLKEGGSNQRTGWHQDVSDMNAAGADMAVLWMSFDPVDQGSALEVVRGSHLGPVYDSIYGKFRSQPRPEIESARADWDVVGFATEPGDVVVFHMATLHGGGTTDDGGRRRSLALRYVGSECVVARSGKRHTAGEPYGRAFTQVL